MFAKLKKYFSKKSSIDVVDVEYCDRPASLPVIQSRYRQIEDVVYEAV